MLKFLEKRPSMGTIHVQTQRPWCFPSRLPTRWPPKWNASW